MRAFARACARSTPGTPEVTQRAQPYLRPVNLFAFALGVAVLQRLPSLPDMGLSLFLMVLSALLFLRYRRVAVLAAFLFGAAFAAWSSGIALNQRLPMSESGTRGQVIAEITDLPQRDGNQWQFEAKIHRSGDFPSLVGRRIKLGWYRTDTLLRSGDIRHLEVTLRTPNGVYNPGGFDAEQRALQKRWAAQGYVRKEIGHVGQKNTIDRFRDALSGQIRRQLGEVTARFVTALALGDTRLLQDADWEVLRLTGITHLIAISGFHVGMVAMAAVWAVLFFYRLWPSLALRWPQPTATAWMAMLAAGMYAAFAGFALPTVRTALMISVFMTCRLLGRHCTVTHAVALSMAVMLLWDPISILTPGFWLSFGGVLLLIAFMPSEGGQGIFRPFMRAQCVASLGLLPLTIGFFEQTTVIGPLVNLLAIPWISLIVVPLALLGCLFSGVPVIAELFWQAGAMLMQVFWILLQWLQTLPWSSRTIPESSMAAVVIGLVGACLLLMPGQVPGSRMGALLLLPMLFPKMDYVPEGQLRVAMMDVGQGTAVLVRTKRHTLLYDTGAGLPGGFSRGQTTVLPALRALGVRHLDKVVVSHGDNDHAGGLTAVRDGVAIDRIDASWRALPANVPHHECLAGQYWQWDSVQFMYVWPILRSNDNDNDQSCVLWIRGAGRSLLLTGDISAEAEAQMLAHYGDWLRAEVLLVPHHGSAGSSSEAFIAAMKPRIALISSGFQNRFRHPRPDVLERYRNAGVHTVNTVDTGWAELAGTPEGWLWSRRTRLDDRRYWLRTPQEPSVNGY